MGSDEHEYVTKKLAVTLEILATHPGDARERLLSAYYTFHVLLPRDFPPHLQDRWRKVLWGISKFGPQYNEFTGEIFRSPLEHTLMRIRKSTAAAICKSILDIYWQMSSNRRYL